MIDETIENYKEVGCDFFKLQYLRSSNKKLDYYLDRFNPEDYWIYKSTEQQRLVSIEDFLEFKYATYVLFKKGVYDYKIIDESLRLLKEKQIQVKFLHKPLPPIEILKKIKIKLWQITEKEII